MTTKTNTQTQSLENLLHHYHGRVERVVDGDTLDIVFDLGFSVMRKERVRLARINTPEISGRKARTEKVRGLAAKQYVQDLLDTKGNALYIQTKKLKKGKYNRIIADLQFEDGTRLSDAIVEAGHGEYVTY